MRERRASRLKPFREASGPPYPGSSRPRRLFLVGVRIDLVGNPGLANADRVLFLAIMMQICLALLRLAESQQSHATILHHKGQWYGNGSGSGDVGGNDDWVGW